MAKNLIPVEFISSKEKLVFILKLLVNKNVNVFISKRKYIPELRNYPIEYLFEPWKAPLEVQIESECVIGKDYPGPCVDHKEKAKENLQRLKTFYENESRKPDVNAAFQAEKTAIRPSNSIEYNVFTHATFLNIFEDF